MFLQGGVTAAFMSSMPTGTPSYGVGGAYQGVGSACRGVCGTGKESMKTVRGCVRSWMVIE